MYSSREGRRPADDVVRERETERETERGRRLQYPCRLIIDFIRYPSAAGRHRTHREFFTVTHRTLQWFMATVGCSGFVYVCISMMGQWACVSDHWRIMLYILQGKAVRSNLVDTRSLLQWNDIARKCTRIIYVLVSRRKSSRSTRSIGVVLRVGL